MNLANFRRHLACDWTAMTSTVFWSCLVDGRKWVRSSYLERKCCAQRRLLCSDAETCLRKVDAAADEEGGVLERPPCLACLDAAHRNCVAVVVVVVAALSRTVARSQVPHCSCLNYAAVVVVAGQRLPVTSSSDWNAAACCCQGDCNEFRLTPSWRGCEGIHPLNVAGTVMSYRTVETGTAGFARNLAGAVAEDRTAQVAGHTDRCTRACVVACLGRDLIGVGGATWGQGLNAGVGPDVEGA